MNLDEISSREMSLTKTNYETMKMMAEHPKRDPYGYYIVYNNHKFYARETQGVIYFTGHKVVCIGATNKYGI